MTMRTTALLVLVSGCGYRPVLSGKLPGDVRSVRVTLPDPSRTDEPELARWLGVELVRQLGRAGLRVVTTGSAESELTTRILGLEPVTSSLDSSGRRVGGRVLRLRLEFRLSDRGDQTLWRSGLVEVEDMWPLSPRDTGASESARRMSLRRLAARGAEQAADLLLSGLGP
jgi:hypothetical protein